MQRKTLTKKEITKILKDELLWCRNNSTEQFSKEYQIGFMRGIEQSILLIKNYAIYDK